MAEDDPRLRATLPNANRPATTAETGAAARLVFVDGDRRGEIVTLSQPEVTIGRQHDNSVVIKSDRVSRHHCSLREAGDGKWTLIDLGSVNGTSINGRRIQAQQASLLKGRDVIQLPGITMIFLQPQADAAQASSGDSGQQAQLTLNTIQLDPDKIRDEADEAIRNFLGRNTDP